MIIAYVGIIKSDGNKKNIMKNVLWIVVAAVIFAAYTCFSNIQDEIITFNDAVIDLLEQDEESFSSYVDYLDKYYGYEEIDVKQMNIALDTLSENHQSIVDKITRIVIPDYDVCREFHAVVMKFLDNDANIITVYTDIIKYIESNNPGTEADLYEISNMLNPFLELNDSIFNEIEVTQKSMSDKFRFRLE
ncbi:MAG: hypothetical protein A3I13_05735 [Gammaproteobacteria bacterium RIFCSPLOWO2_02_FULL_47_50]|nr:MAG: hypothetical protein A2993_00735 [Gammaproteobacteria bacterium RIFCSPLOWO2_01_FULL_47_190]OGT74847.1 MAG: hypothetical protein A2W76_00130 [Gammaproteobacteria bacterium RIFCSPLOWO2_12_47_11]OGT80915.1 MAG: hypothetical protein A3I13_05735 [Gammaproteobacteria bacterium RIFCSPLOWO2_02_FULL_47_50]OGT86736.1 MAG: hypothetical protein A3G42_01170 [Gammaproteobacteria bacterium RIFCSPLOWO2_12_FULL_47_76]